MGSNKQTNGDWSGHPPFTGDEDSAFDEGNDEALSTGVNAELSKLYERRPELEEYRNERLRVYRDQCANVVLFDPQLESLSDIDARIRFVEQNLPNVVETESAPAQLQKLINTRSRLFRDVQWADGEGPSSSEAFFDALEPHTGTGTDTGSDSNE